MTGALCEALYMKKIICFVFGFFSLTLCYCQSAKIIDDYTRNIELNPYSFESYYERAFAKSQIHDTSGAMADYSKAIEINPKYNFA